MKNDIASGTQGAPTRGRSAGFALMAAAAVLLALFVAYMFIQRSKSERALARWTRERAIPSVSLVEPHSESQAQPLSLPGNIAAWYEASIYAQVSGYIKGWRTDIGAPVKKGDMLAEVDTPELDEKIAEAKEQLSRAQAALSLAKVTAERWDALRGSSAVSKQSADEKTSDLAVKQAEVGAASANLDRLKAQKLFAQIVAPYDGVVTARNIDIGSYVGPGRNAPPLFKVADNHAVRVYVNAPQIYSALLTPGMKAAFTTPQWKNREFQAKVATTSNAIAANTGSLLVELDAPNDDGALFPGSYADVRFELPPNPSQLLIPAGALSIGEHGARVATVDAQNRVKFKRVVIAKDLGSEIALSSGLDPQDRIVNNPPETLADGDEVRISDTKAEGGKE